MYIVKIIKIEGDVNHPYTKGFICKKGQKHIERHNHPKRQYNPLLKVNNEWKGKSFEKALTIMAVKYNLSQGDLVTMESSEGKIKVLLQIDESICDDVVMMYVGWWKNMAILTG